MICVTLYYCFTPPFKSPPTRYVYLIFKKAAIPGLFFFIFVFSMQLIVNVQYKFLPMTGFELRTSGIGSNHSTNWATTTAQYVYLIKNTTDIVYDILYEKHSPEIQFNFPSIDNYIVVSNGQLLVYQIYLSPMINLPSVTSKKLPNCYKSCPIIISQEKWKILTALQKLLSTVGNLGKIIVATGFEKLP